MFSPRGGGTRAYVGHLITFAISTLGNLTESLGSRVGTFDFFGEEDTLHELLVLNVQQMKDEARVTPLLKVFSKV